MQTLRLGLAYIAAQVAGGVVGAAAAFSSLPGQRLFILHLTLEEHTVQ